MKHSYISLGLSLILAACGGTSPPESSVAPVPAPIAMDLDLPVTAEGLPFGAALWVHPDDPARNLVVAAAGLDGLTLRSLDGKTVAAFTGPTIDALALAYGFDTGNRTGALVVAHDRTASGLRAFTIDPATSELRQLTAAPLPLEGELTGLCAYRSGISGKYYAFAVTDSGEMQQWELHASGGNVQGRVVRHIPVGAGSGYCVADDAGRVVYVADEKVGIWKIDAEPEADLENRELLDFVAPRGSLGEEVKGLALYAAGDAKYLLAADEEAGSVHVYSLPSNEHVGLIVPAWEDSSFESLWAGAFAAEPRQAGVVLIADQGGPNAGFRLLRWDAVAAALKLPAAAPLDPRLIPAVTEKLVEPAVETVPVLDYGDAADDPAIWVNPQDPAKSLVIGAQKKRGIEVYDLTGKRVQVLETGRTNNVDLRQGVLLDGRPRDIVAGSNRDYRTLTLYEVDRSGRLKDVSAAPIPTGFGDPYGLCMYHSARSGRLYVFVNDPDKGDFRQWEIMAEGAGLTAKLVREFTVGTQAEGCAADDDLGALYIGEEDVGLWRYPAEPDDTTERRQLDSTAEAGRLKADVEGIGIFRGKDGTGYLVVSNQGADNYAVYRREGDNAFIGRFSIVANDELGIDGASETDGLDVTSIALGKAFPQGLLVVQDGRNITPNERQNFKLVPWERVAVALGL